MAGVMLPALAFAQTDVQSQIQSLLSQINALQEQLRALVTSNAGTLRNASSSASWVGMPPGQVGKAACIILGRNLRHGVQGDDVRKLQEMLAEDPENDFRASATGFFGPLTARAVAKFQMRMGIASSTDGFVGPLTRGFFERRCGEGLDKDEYDVKRGKVAGEITAASASSITVIADGRSHVVLITASTTVQVFATATSTPSMGTIADLTVGKRVVATGTVNQDGSISAIHVQVGAVPSLVKRMMLKFDHRGRMMDDDNDDR